MSRIRFTLISASMMIALGLLTLNSIAQPPGGGGGGRGGFQKGGGPGGPGGFGGPGGPVLRLVMNPAVQDDLKLKDKQKAAIKSLSEKVKSASDGLNKQRQEFFKAAGINFGGPGGGFGGGGPGGGGGGGQAGGNANAQGGQNAGGRGRRGQNGDPNAAQGAPNQKGGRGNRPQFTEEQQEQMQMLRASEQEITQNTESALSKILDKTQVARVKQIQLQLDGPQALLREDMVEKLNMTDEQLEQIRELRNEQRQASRAVQKSRGEFFAKLMPPPDNNAQNGNQRGGRGGGGRGNFNPEAMKKAMEDPETQKQMEQFRDESSKIDEQFSATIYNKVLYPRQRTTYKKMLGAPFDRSKMFGAGGPGGWFMPGGRGGANAAAKKDASPGAAKPSAKANPDDDDAAESATAAPTPAKAPAPTANPKRKSSLRDRRGSSGDTPEDQ